MQPGAEVVAPGRAARTRRSTMNSNVGRFIWHELMTTDPAAAIAFYSEVVGWKTEPFGDSKDYQMWVGSQGALGGVLQLPEETKKMGAPPHWMATVVVASVDETAAKVKSLGGNILMPPSDIPNVGRFAVIADPQGASISIGSLNMTPHDVSKAGEFVWNELMSTDHEAGFRFYGEIFGWAKTSEFDMGPEMGKYLLFGKDGAPFGGMMTKTKDMPGPSAWVYYVHVDDLDAAVERAKGKGATLMHGPMEVPTGERVAVLTDPQGAVFALHGNPLAKPAA
jgi:uncharacterized protein